MAIIEPMPSNKRNSVTLTFLGDIAFNDRFQELLEAGVDPFAEVKPLLEKADGVVGNLEVVAFGSAQNMLKRPRIGTSLKALDELRNLHLKLVSLATNHFYDNLEEGFLTTVNKLNELGIQHVGSNLDSKKAKEPAILEIKGWQFGFVNFVHADTHPSLPDDASVHTNFFELEEVVSQVKSLKPKVDRVIALLHWGGKTDYGYLPHKEQLAQAQRIIEAGADAIVGCHTHTFQTHEIINGKPVYYGLGNFCFSDIHCDGGVYTVRESGKKGGLLNLTFFDDGRVEHWVHPIYNQDHKILLKPELAREFKWWQRYFNITKVLPFGFALYYWGLRRIEPIYYYSQLSNVSIPQIAINKLKKLVKLK
ncbi:MAG: CapA family protein [Flavobacteriales bacterium]|nr:CapA family protein [Flavobacteriales bacterium]